MAWTNRQTFRMKIQKPTWFLTPNGIEQIQPSGKISIHPFKTVVDLDADGNYRAVGVSIHSMTMFNI